MNPLVTVVTATYRRPRMLVEQCIPSVWEQTYSPIEHLIVSDGPDPELARTLEQYFGYGEDEYRRYLELPQHVGGVGAEPRRVGAAHARGEWITYLDDDNFYRPDHIETMVDAAVRHSVQLVCTAWEMPDGATWGWAPPGTNNTDSSSFMHHRSLLELSTWRHEDGYAADGALIDRWMARGVLWRFLPEPTLVYTGRRDGRPE